MTFLDLFRPYDTMSATHLRKFMDDHHPEEFQLVDVRQPGEYEQGHLPGAYLIPVDSLEDSLEKLDPAKPVITYCAAGPRSRAAAGVLANHGFEAVYFLSGGMNGWEGNRAEGSPEPDLEWFRKARTPEEHVALAWYLEDGTRTFYSRLADLVRDLGDSGLFMQLAAAEERHKTSLKAVYEGLTGIPAPADFPHSVLSKVPDRNFMEGGFEVDGVLAWAQDKSAAAILEVALAIETNAYDRYLLLRRELTDEHARRVFEVLSDEEKRHLDKLTRAFEELLK